MTWTQLSRSEFITLAVTTMAGLIVPDAATPALAQTSASRAPSQVSGDEVLRQLVIGNAQFAKGDATSPRRRPEDYRAVAEGQNPIAVILSCADSRVPPELLFDMGVGDLFVIRVAGNVVGGAGPVVKGSVEYAVAELGVPLIMVLGHSGCGAVKAALTHIGAKDALPGAIHELVELVKPAVARAKGEPGDPLDNAIRANVKLGVERLKKLKPILAPRVAQGRLKVVGGVYHLRAGTVSLLG
ncbi:MAG: carbonic anhydrase [Candidatus Rokuibacteriota bacterium]